MDYKSKNIPQLDYLSFHTQLFWVLIFSYLLYFVCLNFFIKEIAKTLKIRVKLITLLKRLYSVYFARFFLDSKTLAFQKIKTKKSPRKFFIFRNVIQYQKSTRCI